MGVDEYATIKRRHYGTVLVDLGTRRPIDLLPGQETSALAAWLVQRHGIEVVHRDRGPFFAQGAAAGAPQAVHSRTGGTCGTTSARRPSEPSPSTPAACAFWSPRHPSLSLNRPRRKGRPDRPDRPATGSPTAPVPRTPPSTHCWRQAIAAARSSVGSAWPAEPSNGTPTLTGPKTYSPDSGRTVPPAWTSTRPP
ncbi:transposase [Streptomyces sp. NBC_01435]|uniref:transposase n=1 Tax=Streptomyces sp. NBC_01435 TaxID=2903865 RepID=UPI002E311B80|nr:transposase [Streptomyces sp. NBC_01435]